MLFVFRLGERMCDKGVETVDHTAKWLEHALEGGGNARKETHETVTEKRNRAVKPGRDSLKSRKRISDRHFAEKRREEIMQKTRILPSNEGIENRHGQQSGGGSQTQQTKQPSGLHPSTNTDTLLIPSGKHGENTLRKGRIESLSQSPLTLRAVIH